MDKISTWINHNCISELRNVRPLSSVVPSDQEVPGSISGSVVGVFSSEEFYNPIEQQPIEGQGLPVDCWAHVHLSAGRCKQSSTQGWCESIRRVSSRCWLSRPGLPLQISSCPNSSRCCVDTDPIHCPKMSPPWGIERVLYTLPWYGIKEIHFKSREMHQVFVNKK